MISLGSPRKPEAGIHAALFATENTSRKIQYALISYGGIMNKTDTAVINEILATLTNGVSAIRKSGDRQMMREAVIRIRQLRGILELR